MTTLARPVIAETAVVAPDALVGPAPRVWHFAQIRARSRTCAKCQIRVPGPMVAFSATTAVSAT